MLGPKLKIATLVAAVCLGLMLGSYSGCSAKKPQNPQNPARAGQKPARIYHDYHGYKVNFSDLDPANQKKAPKLQKRLSVVNLKANKPVRADYDEDEDASKNKDLDGVDLLDKHHALLKDYVKKLNKDLKKVLKRSGKTSVSKRTVDIPILTALAKQAICLIEIVMGLGDGTKDEWVNKCCPFVVMRVLAPFKCENFDPNSVTTTPKPDPTEAPTKKPSEDSEQDPTETPKPKKTTSGPITIKVEEKKPKAKASKDADKIKEKTEKTETKKTSKAKKETPSTKAVTGRPVRKQQEKKKKKKESSDSELDDADN